MIIIIIIINIDNSNTNDVCVHIHIYIYRERERYIHIVRYVYTYIYIYMYIYIYIERERERSSAKERPTSVYFADTGMNSIQCYILAYYTVITYDTISYYIIMALAAAFPASPARPLDQESLSRGRVGEVAAGPGSPPGSLALLPFKGHAGPKSLLQRNRNSEAFIHRVVIYEQLCSQGKGVDLLRPMSR